MRRLIATTLLASAAMGLMSCSSAEEVGDTLGQEAASADTPSAPAVPAAPAAANAKGEAVDISEETDDYSFEFSYPAQAGAIPGLKSMLDVRLDEQRSALKANAAEAKADAAANDFPFNGFYYSEGWQVVADLPRFLSLSSTIGTYSGGAHGNSNFDSLVWDREAGKALEPEDVFTSMGALDNAIGKPLCKALNRERTKRRGETYGENADGDGMFDDCLSPEAANILLGSSNGKTFDRVGFRFAPYVAGAYAEGSYEVTLPVDAAMLKAVKPEYREAFAAKR